MNDYYKDRKYFVYRHVAPNGKMYIGITSKQSPEERWGYMGCGYESNRHFWNAIQKYGWDNFSHIIVAHDLNVDTACHLEEYLIKKYDTMNNGYNQTSGGVKPTEVTDEIRNKISTKIREYHNSLSEGEWSNKFKGHRLSEATKKKIGAKQRGRTISEDVINRRKATFQKNLTPERRAMYSSFSKGRKLSGEHRKALSERNKGRYVSESTRQKLRDSLKIRYKNNKYVWVHLGDKELEIKEINLDEYLAKGYTLGRSNIKNIYITKDDKTVKINASDLDTYLAEGWKLGFSKTRYDNIKKSKIKFIYEYDNQQFYYGYEVVSYLKNHGYPKISQGTVDKICAGNTVLKYSELSTALVRRSINEGC